MTATERTPEQPSALPQSVRDALADAETFRMFMRDGREFCRVGYPNGWYLGVMDLGRTTRKHIREGYYNAAARSAGYAAREAFAAVPELREDRQ